VNVQAPRTHGLQRHTSALDEHWSTTASTSTRHWVRSNNVDKDDDSESSTDNSYTPLDLPVRRRTRLYSPLLKHAHRQRGTDDDNDDDDDHEHLICELLNLVKMLV